MNMTKEAMQYGNQFVCVDCNHPLHVAGGCEFDNCGESEIVTSKQMQALPNWAVFLDDLRAKGGQQQHAY